MPTGPRANTPLSQARAPLSAAAESDGTYYYVIAIPAGAAAALPDTGKFTMDSEPFDSEAPDAILSPIGGNGAATSLPVANKASF